MPALTRSRLATSLPFPPRTAVDPTPIAPVRKTPGVWRWLARWLMLAGAGGLLLWYADRLPGALRSPALWTGGMLACVALLLLPVVLIWKILYRLTGRRVAIAVFLIGFGGMAVFIGSAAHRAAGYSLDLVLAEPPRPDLLFRDGALYTHPDTGCRPLTSLSQMTPHLPAAVIAVEDIRFHEHRGVDGRGLAGAVRDTLRGKTRGGSTLLMQLIDNQFDHSNASSLPRRIWYKFVEIFAAPRLFDEAETRFESAVKAREQFLLAYLNRVEFGHGQVGAAAAANFWFAQPDLTKLTLGQAAQLAGMLQNQRKFDPLAHPDAAAARRQIVIQCMVTAKFITAKEAARDRCDLDRTPHRARPLHDGFLPHRTQSLLDAWHRDGLIPADIELHDPVTRVTLTIDREVQATLESAMKSRAAWIRRQTEHLGLRVSDLEAAAVVLRNEDASIAALMCGLRFDKSATDNLFVATHVPASTIKPFLYAAVPGLSTVSRFSNHRFTRADTAPFDWCPENPSGLPQAWHPLSAVLARSDNWAAGRTGWRYRREILTLTEKLHLSPNPADLSNLHPDYAIGTRPVRLIDLAAAGRALACNGLWRPAWLIQSATGRRAAFTNAPAVTDQILIPPASAQLIRSALHDTLTTGTAAALRRSLGSRPDTWAKTGTSEHNRDCLILGGNSRCTVVVWFGRLKGSDPVLPQCSGASLCGPVLTEILRIR